MKICKHEMHGGVCKKTETYCNLGACPYEEPIEVIEVVRCKDCKWFDPREEIEGEMWTGYCIYGEFHTDEMDFCSRGERKEE